MRLWGSDLKDFRATQPPSMFRKVLFWVWASLALLVWAVVFGVYAYQCCVFWGLLK